MPQIELPSKAEQQANKCASLSAFAGLSVPSVRSDLTQLLQLIRANSMFEEYTKHDISHIDRMLSILDWLVPDETQKIMTPADWLLIVLATYFHDLGMLITRDEYEKRGSTAFTSFKAAIVADETQATQDYVARVNDLPEDEVDKFLYQEYVRQNHASRVRAWIEGRRNDDLGITEAVAAEIARILSPLEEVFAEDLAIVCESHHLNDLDNVIKYSVSRPYGSTSQETANVQYAAVLLRTIDLLHITSDRAPSIAFRIINPRDPISQREWAKQAAVRSVRPKIAADDEGILNPKLQKETIEVHARFNDAEGYFGLTSYLAYAETQIRQSHDWIVQSNRRYSSAYFFPWRFIDISNIEAKGFIPQPFSFSLNQEKILELLTGHTLYNEPSVVVRELLQNAIDAVRVEHGTNTAHNGVITLQWYGDKRILEVLDNGTGMTQEIIEQNFLSVGTSYYQSPRFREIHPSFNPISRFGIGVLSAFMVADQVEVITCHVEEPDARRLELRTVQGQYLIKLLDKRNHPEAKRVGPHGTLVRLYLRPTATLDDIIELAQRWIVVPNCKIIAITDDATPVQIGYRSVSDALEAAIYNRDTAASIDDNDDDEDGDSDEDRHRENNIRIVQLDANNVSLAYAVRWSSFFKEWEFLYQYMPYMHKLGTCVEGVRVQSGSPGFTASTSNPILVAIANITGQGAPKTNVARSEFEYTPEYERNLRQIYLLYAQHINDELNKMQLERKQSLTWATSEATWLIRALFNMTQAISSRELARALRSIPILLVEEDGRRHGVSADELATRQFFWTIDGALPSHIEYLLREIPESISLTALLKGLQSTGVDLPDGPILCTQLPSGLNTELILSQWQIAELRGNEERRRSEARWIKAGGPTMWSAVINLDYDNSWSRLKGRITEAFGDPYSYSTPWRNTSRIVRIPVRGVEASGFGKYSAVSMRDETYLLPGTQWTSVIKVKDGDPPFEDRGPSDEALHALGFMLSTSIVPLEVFDDRVMKILRRSEIPDLIDLDMFFEMRKNLGWRVYDTRQWQRPWSA